jgi:hypothetical protein
MNASMAKYRAMQIPYLNIPPYGADPIENTPPAFTSTPGATPHFSVGQAYTYLITATDADGQALTISATVRPSWLTLTNTNSGTAILTGATTNSAVTSYPVMLRVSDGITTKVQSFVITLNTGFDFASWIGGFKVGSQNGTGDDPDYDGIPNLIEYALQGGDPTQGGAGIFPTVSLTKEGGDRYLTLTIQKSTTATSITLIAETCSDLASWNSSNTVIVSETASTLVVRDALPVSGSSTRSIRLKVTQP